MTLTAKHLKDWLILCWVAGGLSILGAAERPVDPTFLKRSVGEAGVAITGFTTPSCRYQALFGEGDPESGIVRGVARYGIATIAPGGHCATASYRAEEQIYFVLEGEGKVRYEGQTTALKREDFAYLAPGSRHGLSNPTSAPLKVLIIGYKTPEDRHVAAPAKLPVASVSQADKRVLSGHPASTKYQLLMGNVDSKRDLLATAEVLTSLFVMEFDAGGTNHPHHHLKEEEIYIVLEGEGEMAAGGGMDGVVGRHRVQAGDAYFFRPNCTVGFYAPADAGSTKVRILAARSLYPGMKK